MPSTLTPNTIVPSPTTDFLQNEKRASAKSTMISGVHKNIVKAAIWVNIFRIALREYKSVRKALGMMRKLANLRDSYRENRTIIKYAQVANKYYYVYYAPGWPSKAFNRFIENNFRKIENPARPILNTLILGITKKCGYKCEHCFEWDHLNKPEVLTKEDLVSIVASFEKLGVTQVQLSGGEPLNRLDDIIYMLNNISKSMEVWLYTSGYHLTHEKARRLKDAGLTGVVVSLDHWSAEKHDRFRGKDGAFRWAEEAVLNCRKENIIVCLSLCATKDFISKYNLNRYVELAKSWDVSFIQVFEPKAVGHYAGQDVSLHEEHILQLEEFFVDYNFSPDYKNYPAIMYHGFYSRRVGCSGGGNFYVYVDTDGDVHNCTFCKRKLFSAFDPSLEDKITMMRQNGCSIYPLQKQ